MGLSGTKDWPIMGRSETPLVSIVTPVLNRATTIANCLASVAAQSYGAIEHIVVDGGSTDGTQEVLASFRSPYELRWISEPDEGMYDAINKGMAGARGSVLAYLNSDDLYFPWSVEAAVEGLGDGADLVYGDLVIMAKGSDWVGVYPQFYPPFDLKHYTYVGRLGQPTVFWDRRVRDAIGDFDVGFRLVGDCEYWLRASTAGFEFSHIAEFLAVQVEHGDTLRAKYPVQVYEELDRMIERYAARAGRRSPAKVENMKRSLRWRQGQIRFFAAARRATPSRWPRFMGFLKDHDVELSQTGLLLRMLPEWLRPADSSLVNAAAFERELLSELRAAHG